MFKLVLLLTCLTTPFEHQVKWECGFASTSLIHYIQRQISSLNYSRSQPFAQIAQTMNGVCYFDPTLIVKNCVKDSRGRVFFEKGESFNPFDYAPLARDLLFFDARKSEQLKWARSKGNRAIWILPSGQIEQITEGQNCPVFIDHKGTLSALLCISTSHPTQIIQEGNQLRIEPSLHVSENAYF